MKKNIIWIIVIAAIIVIAIYFYNKNKNKPTAGLTDAQAIAGLMSNYGLTSSEASAFVKAVRCVEKKNALTSALFLPELIGRAKLVEAQQMVLTGSQCGLTASETDSATSAFTKINV